MSVVTELGCGVWQAFLDCRGGGDLAPLPFATLTMSRRVDEISGAGITLTADRLRTERPDEQERCCGLLGILEPWEHELALWRSGDDDVSWCGPILEPVWHLDDVSIPARDLKQWFERRLLERPRNFVATDLATIYSQYFSDGLHRDVTPNITPSITATGIVGDRSIDPNAGKRAADEMRELERSGLDVVMIGRTLIGGGVEVPTADLGKLITEHFDDHELLLSGLNTETESVVIGNRPDNVGSPVRASAGGVTVQRGLVQGVVTESSIEDTTSCQAAADSRLALLEETPTMFKARLLPTAPVRFDKLIPGAVADLRVQLFCRSVQGPHRLMDVDVSVDNNGVESVHVTFSSLGTTEESM